MSAPAIRKNLKGAVASLLLLVFGAYLWSIRQGFVQAFQSLSAKALLTLAATLVLQWLLRAWRDAMLYRATGHSPGFMSLVWLNNLQLSLNYLPLKAGTLSSAEILRSRFGVPFRDFAVNLGQQLLLTLFASSALAAGALWLAAEVTDASLYAASAVFVGVAVSSIGALSWRGVSRILPRFVTAKIRESAEKLAVFSAEPRRAAGALLLTAAFCLVSAFRMTVLFGLLDADLSFPAALVIAAALQLSALLSITPAGIGITEAVSGLSALLMNLPPQDGVVAATIDRAVILALSIVISLVFAPFAWGRKHEPM